MFMVAQLKLVGMFHYLLCLHKTKNVMWRAKVSPFVGWKQRMFFFLLSQGQDGPTGDKGDDGEPGQTVSNR